MCTINENNEQTSDVKASEKWENELAWLSGCEEMRSLDSAAECQRLCGMRSLDSAAWWELERK